MSVRRAVLAAVMFCLFGAAPISADPEPRPDRIVAIGPEIASDGARTRLTFTLSGQVTATAFVMEAPDRVVVELPDVTVELGAEAASRRGGLVSGIRGGLFAPGRSRIVVDLASPASVSRLSVAEATLPGTLALELDLVRSDRDSFRRAVAADRSDLVLTTGSLPARARRDDRPLIAIDAGHGGADSGAKSAGGVQEKDVTLAFAETLAERLAAGGRYRLLMVRDHDVFVPLDERVRVARDAGADLFLSIHADWTASRHVSGATVYTGSERATDGESASLAERENAADLAGGVPGTPLPQVVTDILQDLTTRETRAVSAGFSKLLLRDLGPAVRLTSYPHREAGFRVLRSHDLPAVLVELGYMSNPRDLELMLSPDWRRRTAAVMAGSVDRFFAGKKPVRAAMSP